MASLSASWRAILGARRQCYLTFSLLSLFVFFSILCISKIICQRPSRPAEIVSREFVTRTEAICC